MRRLLFPALAALAACARAPSRPFALGFLRPASARVAAAARGMGLEVAERAPAGAAEVSAIAASEEGRGETTADHARIRFLAARAIAEGAGGVYFRLPSAPAGVDYLDYPEESQALERVLRELLILRPILQEGTPSAPPFAVPTGIERRAWDWQGRRYVLLVNASAAPLPLDVECLRPWRALFAVRADPREALGFCGPGRCLEEGGVLWLEGRLAPGL
jgi:hypothetical protein